MSKRKKNKKEIRTYLRLTENIAYQNLWDAVKQHLEIYNTKHFYYKKERSHVKNLRFHLKKLEKEE